MSTDDGSILAAVLWMAFLSLLLFWLPVFGPLIAGFVGGRSAGGVGNALLAALLPTIVLGVLMFVFGTALTTVPVIGIVASMGAVVLALSQIGPLLLGALIGGALAPRG